MSYRQPRCIIVVAALVLLTAATVVVRAGTSDRLIIAGHQVTDQAVLVTVHNPGADAEQGVVSLGIRLRGQRYLTATAVFVPAGATMPVAFEIPREWAGPRLKIDVLIATDGFDASPGKKGEGSPPADTGGDPRSAGNQITEGPDTVGG